MNARRMYETTFIINAALEDAAIDTIVNTTVEFMKTNGASINKVDKWGRKRLAYPIQKKNNGYYVYVQFDAPANLLPQLERYFFLEENIMRHLNVAMTKTALEARNKFFVARAEAEKEAAAAELAAQAEAVA
jgi:small subunit ribosomal protein S6